MDNREKQKAHDYFVETYGADYDNRGHLMSFGYSTLPRLVRYSSKLSSDAKICYETLTDMIMNNDETIPWLYYPSQKRIALLSGLRRQQVSKAMRELQNANLVGSKRQGLGRQNVYCLLAPTQEFVDGALKCRAILNLIKREEMSWDDISDNNEVSDSNIFAKIEAEKSMVTPDVSHNVHQEVFSENAHQLNDSTTEGNNSQIHQEVFSENALQALPPKVAPAISEKQELTSVDVTSDDIKDSSVSESNSSEQVISNNPGKDNNFLKDEKPSLMAPEKYQNWGFASLHTKFQTMLKNKASHRDIIGIVHVMLDILGVTVAKKDGTPNFSIAGKIRKIGDKSSAELLWRMWQMKRDGVLTSPNGYLHSVLGGKTNGK